MSHTPHRLPVCTHERGVGTTLCLHCRREARIAARDKRKRLMLRGSAAAIVIATGLAATALGATAIRGRSATRHAGATPKVNVANTVGTVVAPASDSTPASQSDSVALSATPTTTTPAVTTRPPAAGPSTDPVAVANKAAESAKRAVAPLVPTIAPGSSPLADGVTAFRGDSEVTVSFDLPMVRTRIPDKFERFVRTTLRQVYGSKVDSALAKLPAGALTRQGDLLTQLPSTGMQISIADGWVLRVYPETRKGQEGPLVVRYRAVTCETRDTSCGAR